MMKVSIFHWGELTINAYYLATALKEHNISIDFYLYSPRSSYKELFKKDLYQKVTTEFRTTEFSCSFIDSCLMKLMNVSRLFSKQDASVLTNPRLPARTQRIFKPDSCNYIITIGQASLYWLFKTDPASLSRTLHYSLEIQKTTDPYFITPAFASVLEWETKLLQKVKGLIIQDAFRAEALLNCKIDQSKLIFFFLPVSIVSKPTKRNHNYLSKDLNISADKKIILYFGAMYPERCLEEVAEILQNDLDDSWILVLHGPNDFSDIATSSEKVKLSRNLLNYDDLHLIISSATIGLALYDNSWPNTRYTAFSSEKIARYLQAGVPFIAFKNESYLKLKDEFDCCYLIETVEDLSIAISSIMQNYELYKLNCLKAFDKYFNIQSSILPLSSFVKGNDHSVHMQS